VFLCPPLTTVNASALGTVQGTSDLDTYCGSELLTHAHSELSTMNSKPCQHKVLGSMMVLVLDYNYLDSKLCLKLLVAS